MATLEEMGPEELRTYVKELREENAQRRKDSERFKVFERYSDAEKQGLLNMIEVLSEDTKAGGEMFRNLANSILDDEEEETPPAPEKEDDMSEEVTEDTSTPNVQELIAAAVKEAMEAARAEFERPQIEEQERQVEEWNRIAADLGYQPGTPEYQDLFFTASKLESGDLSEAHERLTKFNEFLTGEPTEPVAPKEFPKTGAVGSTGAPEPKGEEIDFSDAKAVRAAMMARLDSVDETP